MKTSDLSEKVLNFQHGRLELRKSGQPSPGHKQKQVVTCVSMSQPSHFDGFQGHSPSEVSPRQVLSNCYVNHVAV